VIGALLQSGDSDEAQALRSAGGEDQPTTEDAMDDVRAEGSLGFYAEAEGPYDAAADFDAAVDDSPWDGNRALGECETAADYRSICAGERGVGEPDQRQHWALPHHYLSRVPSPNAAGVRNALARLPQTQGLTNRDAAQRHLDAHMREINPAAASDEILRLRAEIAKLSD